MTYASCAGVGLPVTKVTRAEPSPAPGRVGGDGTGICAVCGREVAQRGASAKRHKDKR